ncbi:hypothetical protein [Candidatus Flexifilum breve]|uniref:hypothetical protein n=1 Tax=Candidatus Flexifilum breve TaxID=3140694 RepID=UPI0031CCCC2D
MLLGLIPAFVLALSMIVIVNQLHLPPSVGLGWRGLFSQETRFCRGLVWLLLARS